MTGITAQRVDLTLLLHKSDLSPYFVFVRKGLAVPIITLVSSKKKKKKETSQACLYFFKPVTIILVLSQGCSNGALAK